VQPTCTTSACAKVYTIASFRVWLVSQIDMANAAFDTGPQLDRPAFSLQSAFNGSCVDIPWGQDNNPGAGNQFPCNAANTDQMWFGSPEGFPAPANRAHIVSAATGECLSAPGGNIKQVPCVRTDTHQMFDLVTIGSNLELVPVSAPGTTLDMP